VAREGTLSLTSSFTLPSTPYFFLHPSFTPQQRCYFFLQSRISREIKSAKNER